MLVLKLPANILTLALMPSNLVLAIYFNAFNLAVPMPEGVKGCISGIGKEGSYDNEYVAP